ncbi:MAG: hypothetical protein ACE5HP_03945 [Gemmatimonadota bacterium]
MKTGIQTVSRLSGIAAYLTLATAACSDDTTGPTPTTDFDARSTAQTLASVTAMPAGSDAVFAQLGLAAGALAQQGGAAGSVSVPTPVPGLPELGPAAVPGLPRLAAFLASRGGAVPIFPVNLLGKTFVWDPATRSYRVDEELTGAPANGVRFILYAISPLTGEPVTPLQPVGFVDLLDESDAAATRLRVTAVDTSGADPVTLVDYVLGGSFEVTTSLTVRLTAEGFLSDGSGRLEFSLSQDITVGESPGTFGIALEHHLNVPGLDASVDLVLTGTGAEGEEDLRSLAASLTIRDGANSAVLRATTSDGSLSGSLRYNGQIVIVIGGTPEAPTFTGPGGEELQPDDLEALEEILEAVEEILGFSEEILQPIAELFGISG